MHAFVGACDARATMRCTPRCRWGMLKTSIVRTSDIHRRTDAADAHVSEDERTALEHNLVGEGILQ